MAYLTHQLGRIEGRLTGLENEAINHVKDLEGRERERERDRDRDRRPAQPPKLELIKVLPWREIIGVTVLRPGTSIRHRTTSVAKTSSIFRTPARCCFWWSA